MTAWLPTLQHAEDPEREAVPVWTVAAIVGFGALLRILAFRGFIGSDDRAYADLAHALASGAYPSFDSDTPVFQNRIGLIAPVAALVRMLGDAEWVYLLYPFAVSLASIALAFAFARALFGNAAGLLAAALMAVLPIEMSMATHLVPDPIATFWANLGVFAVWHATRSEGVKRSLIFGLIAGLCFGLGWLHKVSIAYLAPFVGVVLIAHCARRPRTGSAALAATAGAALAVLIAESLGYAWASGDPLFRFASLSRNFEQTQLYWFVEGGRFGWEPGHFREALLQRLFVSGPERIFLSRAYAHLPLAALLVGLLALRTREKRLAFCGLWFATLLLFFDLGTTSLEYYKPLVLFQRYLYPLVLPSILLFCGGIAMLKSVDIALWRLQVPRVALALLVCLPVARGIVAGLDREFSRAPENAGVRQVARAVDPRQELVSDPRTLRDLQFFWGYPNGTRLSAFGDDVTGLAAGSLVFINRERMRLREEHDGIPAPAFWQALPRDWELVQSVTEGELYRVPEASADLQLGHR